MAIEANMQAIIEERKGNFYSQFDQYGYTTKVYEDTTSDFYGLTAWEILEEHELFGDVPQEVLEWARSQKKSQHQPSAGDPDFDLITGFDEDGNPIYDEKKLKIYNTRVAKTKALKISLDANANIYYTDDESSDFFGYTYDEILGMYANGVSIPNEVLEWANSMAEANSSEINENTEGSDAQTLYTTLKNSPFMNIKTITKIFVKRSEEETKELDAILESLEPIEREMAAATVDAETKREKALNNIEAYTQEWLALTAKMEKGETLDPAEQDRFKELQGLFGEEDKKYQENIDDTTKNYNKFNAFLDAAQLQSEVAMDFGEKTIEVAAELADFEKTNKRRTIFGGLVNAGIGGVLNAIGSAGSKNFAKIAHTIGTETTYFAHDVQTTIAEVNLLMSETANNAGFNEEDPTHEVSSLIEDEGAKRAPATQQKTATEEGLTADEDETEPTVTPTITTAKSTTTDNEGESGEATEGSGETSTEGQVENKTEENTEATDEELQNEGTKSLEDVNAKELSHPELKRLIKEEGDDSEKKGKEALKLVDDLKAQSEIVDKKEEEVEKANTVVEETSSEATEGSTESSTTGEKDVANAEADAANTVGELEQEAEKEELTVQGLRETYKGFKKANKKYSGDVKHADKRMKEDIYTGAFTIAGGGYMTGIGIYNIATATSLLSTAFLCPATLALAGYLMDIGIVEVALGASMITGGTALTISANDGLDVNEITKEKIETSNDDIKTATSELDEFAATQAEAAEGNEGEEKTEESEEEENEEVEDPYLSVEEQMLVDMNKGNEELPPMMVRAAKEGSTSSKAGKDNIVALTDLARQIPSLIESTIAFEAEQQAKDASEAAGEADEPQATATQNPAEIYAAHRADFNADLQQNAIFRNDIGITKNTATDNLKLGAIGTAAGTARTALGYSEIALGTMLAANIWNPIQVMIGLALIKKGTEDLALGTAMLTSGLALTVISSTTIAVSEISELQIQASDEKTNFALDKVDEIEAEINEAVKEQMANQGGQDTNGMSVIQLLTLIIANGIKSSGLSAENTELFEALQEQLPEIMDKITGEENIDETIENGENQPQSNTETPDEGEGEGAKGQDENAKKGNDSPFAKYIIDFQNDLKTNTRYSNEVKKAKSQSLGIQSGFFLGKPVEKANARIEESTTQTQTALDETLKMEADYKKAVEEARAQKEEEAKDPEAVAEKVVASSNSKESDSEEEKEMTPKDAEEAAKDSDQINKEQQKDANKSEKKGVKADKQGNKTTKKAKKEDKKAKEADKQGEKSGEEGEKSAENAQPEARQGEADNALGQQSEAESLSAQVLESAAEMTELANTTKAEADAATAENEAINAEMAVINVELQQDQMKMAELNNQIKEEAKKTEGDKPANQPAEPAQKPENKPAEPAQKPVQPQKNSAKKSKKAEKEENKPEENKPAQAPAQQPKPVETEQEKPEGADKTQYASDLNKAPDFVGFVAQSDSLASGAVLAGKTKKTTPSVNNNKQTQGANTNKKSNPRQNRNVRNNSSNKQTENNNQDKKANQQQENRVVMPAQRTNQKPFDINSMQGGANGGNGAGKTEQLKQSAQQIQAQAFNRQAKLSALAVRASNNVQANIQKEAKAQAEAARKEREAAEKQERIAKIKEYAGYVQMAGGLVSATGMIVSWCGKAQMTAGTAQITAGTTQITMGSSTMTMAATTMTSGTAMTATGATMVGTGAAELTTGATAITTGTVQITAGTVMVSTGTAMLSNPFTAAAGAALVSAGTALITSGTALETAGGSLTGLGSAQVPAGTATISAGTGMIGAGSTMMAGGAAQIAAGAATTAAGLGQLASGLSLETTGGIIQTVGVYITAAGALVSAGADFANGNILGGLTTIIGAAASCVGISANVSTLAQAGIQLASNGVSVAGQLAQLNDEAQNQQGGQKKKQPNKKKMQQIKNDKKTNNIMKKTPAVGNRFNK